jgi:diguanylate cyclase (GGDEF)-like protein
MRADSYLKDPLTGALSRLFLRERIREEVERAGRCGEHLSLLLLDLDHFKSVNDAFGYTRGDRVLVEFTDRLRHIARKSDILFRYGGDEFVLLLPKTPKDKAIIVAERTMDGIQKSSFKGDPTLTITLSIGLASYPGEAENPETLFELADIRLHEAKQRGRKQIVSTESDQPATLPFNTTSRLIDRDEELNTVNRFFESLESKKQGVLIITGPRGSGRSRFLRDVGNSAGMRGFNIIPVSGNPALKSRSLGAISEAVYHIQPDDRNLPDHDGLIQSFKHIVETTDSKGLFFTVDNLAELDRDSLELLQKLIHSKYFPRFALAYTAELEASRRVFPVEAPVREAVELRPLSHDGARVWVRYLLKWDPPEDFFRWLYRETGGLPDYFHRGLTYLLRRGILVREGNHWEIQPSFSEITLGEKLGVKATPPPNNLPLILTNFIGRDREIREIKQRLGDCRLVTLIGAAGIGKTRLALQAAAEMNMEFIHGVFFVSLASTQTQDQIITGIANALRVPFYEREKPSVQLANHLREKSLLLILDNFEHLLPDTGLIDLLLNQAPYLKILVTSCERLNLEGESTIQLLGMRTPRGKNLKEFENNEAVQLFVQSARRVSSQFVLDEENRPHVFRICRLLDGMPLGLELAASWVNVLSCSEICREIERNMDFLSTNIRNIPKRHRSLRAVFNYSWNLLSPDDRHRLRSLSIFPGGFTRDAASVISHTDLKKISSLMDKSLMRKVGSDRYIIPGIVRTYARDKLTESSTETHDTMNQYNEYYSAFLMQNRAGMKSGSQEEALNLIRKEIVNLRLFWFHCCEHRLIQTMKRTLHTMYLFYEMQGWFQEGYGQFNRAMQQMDQHVTSSKTLPDESEVLGMLAIRTGSFALMLGQYKEADDKIHRGLDRVVQKENNDEKAFGLHCLGSIAYRTGEYNRSKALFSDSKMIYEQLGDRKGVANSVNSLANVAYRMGQYIEAKQLNKKSLQIFLETNDQWGIANSYNNLGIVSDALGNYLEARDLYEKSIEIKRILDDRWGIANSLNNLGNVAFRLEKYDEAHQLHQESLQIKKEIGDRWRIAITLNNIALIELKLGELNSARKTNMEALQIRREIGDQRGVATSLLNLGNIAYATGDTKEALVQLKDSIRTAVKISALPVALSAIHGVATIWKEEGCIIEALRLYAFIEQNTSTEEQTRLEAYNEMKTITSEMPPDISEKIITESCKLTPESIVKSISTAG